MMSSLYLIVVIVSVLQFHTAFGRTCTCAQFLKDECNAQPCCEWNPEVQASGSNNGNPGVCRSTKFMQCHRDPECTLASRDPRPSSDLSQLSDSVLSAHFTLKADDPQPGDQTNGVIKPKETDNMDWPWNCDTEEYPTECAVDDDSVYASFLVDVSAIDRAARELGGKVKAVKPGKMVDVAKLADPVQTVAGLVFVLIAMAAFVYCKCKGAASSAYNKKPISFESESYSTFNDKV